MTIQPQNLPGQGAVAICVFWSRGTPRVTMTCCMALIAGTSNLTVVVSSALAEMLQADPSTVSRQVQTLVKDGFVERRADPEDGRAALLVVTKLGEQVYADHKLLRNEHYQLMLADWTEEECRLFAEQFF